MSIIPDMKMGENQVASKGFVLSIGNQSRKDYKMKAVGRVLKNVAIVRKAVFVSVTHALSGNAPDILPSTPLVDIARGFWYVDDSKIRQCELLVAVEKGIVRGVWEIDMKYGWHPMTITATPTRDVKQMIIEPKRQYCRVLRAVFPKLKGMKLSAVMGGMRMCGPL